MKEVFSFKKLKICCALAAAVTAFSALSGCGSEQAMQQRTALPVKAVQVIERDAPMNYEYAGQVQARNEVKIQARVSGNIVEKYVNGGTFVSKGQPLFKIDPRTYESALHSAEANLAQSEANLANAALIRARYENLVANDALDVQSLTTQRSVEEQNAAAVAANRAGVKKAQDDLNDTLIVSPVDGRMDVNDLSVGTYVTAGSTTMASVSSTDPVFVQFSMSENEYLRLVANHENGMVERWGDNVTITLSDGSQYPLAGKVEQVDRSLANNSGTLSFKASFENPNRILIPGMFARVKIKGEVVPNAVLVPQRAIQQLLEKSFVTVVDAENKAESREVKLGSKIGGFYIIESGVQSGEKVVVEGLTKIQSGIALDVTEVTPEELQLSFE